MQQSDISLRSYFQVDPKEVKKPIVNKEMIQFGTLCSLNRICLILTLETLTLCALQKIM